jgi:hypothetical protein
MTVYSGKDSRLVTPSITTTDTSANVLMPGLKMWVVHCVDNSTPELFDDLHTETINYCGTVRPNT